MMGRWISNRTGVSYAPDPGGGHRLHTPQVFTVTGSVVAANVVFAEAACLPGVAVGRADGCRHPDPLRPPRRVRSAAWAGPDPGRPCSIKPLRCRWAIEAAVAV